MILFTVPPVLWLTVQSPWAKQYVASRVFSHWVVSGHPEQSILVWDRVRGRFPFSFKIFGSRWRDPECIRNDPHSHDCVEVFAPLIDVSLHPMSFLWGGKMDVEYVTIPQLAVRSNTSVSHLAHPRIGRALLSSGHSWPSFGHMAQFRNFRVDRVSLVPPGRMLAAIVDQVEHPRSRTQVDHGAIDVEIFGSARIAPDGGDWELTATMYTINDDGNFATHENHHAWIHVYGDGATEQVHGQGKFTYADHTRGSGSGSADWAALFGDDGEGRAEFETEGGWGRLVGTVGLDPMLWCNVTAPHNVTVSGHLGSLRDPTSWPFDVLVTHPRAEGRCHSDRCVLDAYGVEVIVRPLETGVEVDHDFGQGSITTCDGSTNTSTWYGMGAAIWDRRNRVCGQLDTVVGRAHFEYADGRVVDAGLEGEREGVVFRGLTVERARVSANMTALDIDLYQAAWDGRAGPDRAHLRVTPSTNWTVSTSDGDWLEGWMADSHTLVVGEGRVRGYRIDEGVVWSTADEGTLLLRVSNESSWLRLWVDGDWQGKTWWDRLREYRVDGHVDHGLSAWGVEVAGVIGIKVEGGGRNLPRANITLADGTLTKIETRQEVRDASGQFTLPGGEYTLVGTYSSPITDATFNSEGYVVLSPSSVEGETYSHYRTEEGAWDRIESSFAWEWGRVNT